MTSAADIIPDAPSPATPITGQEVVLTHARPIALELNHDVHNPAITVEIDLAAVLEQMQ